MVDRVAAQKVSKGRAGLVLDHPFFAALALRLQVVEDITCQTCWTDGIRLGYNPQFVRGLTLEQVKGVWAHECMHCTGQHMIRQGTRDHSRWNVAADYAINPIVIDAGIRLPDGALIERAFRGLSAEEIYLHIQQDADSSADSDADSSSPDPGGCGETRRPTDSRGQPLSPAAMARLAQDWQVATVQAAKVAKAQGRLPGGIDRLIGDVLNPRADWRELLRRFISAVARNDYTWGRPNRRYISRGLYLPSLHSDDLGTVVVAVDTSGSITSRDLSQFAAELTAILEEFPGAVCDVLYCDTEIAGHQRVEHMDLPLELAARGGGGTDFRPPFEWVETCGDTPACLVYLTDGYCDTYPDNPPDYPVLWVGTREFSPPWGDVTELR
jgi:predicted metal-dependent peptidase